MPNNLSVDFSKAEAWAEEITRSRRVAENNHWRDWEENLRYFQGKSPDALIATDHNSNYVNTNSDFTSAEVKKSQLFYETPDLMLSAKGVFMEKAPAAMIPGQPPPMTLPADPIIMAHREIMNDLLEEANVLPTIHKVILDCLVTAGVGATKIGFSAAQGQTVPTPDMMAKDPQMDPQGAIPVPIAEQWYWDRIPSKKFRIPADFTDTDYDKSPYLAMDFRLPVPDAESIMNLPVDYTPTTEKDKKVLESVQDQSQVTTIPYVEGTEIWYYASIFDQDAKNPRLIRRHILVDGFDGFCEKTVDNPYQTLLPNGRLSANSMIGYPIHVLAIRSLPDSAYVPSDSSMIRPLVRELCTFRTQQVQERDANIPRMLYDSAKLTPEALEKIQNGTIGALIPVEGDALMAGIDKIMVQVAQGTQTRGSYTANDYIQHDLDRTLGMDSIGAGVSGDSNRTATEIGTVDKIRSVRLDAERRAVLAWYIKGVQKFSSLVCRFLTPQLAIPLIGPAAAQEWAKWDKQNWDGRFVFKARPDSQVKLDAATERKFALDLYQMVAKDSRVDRGKLLENLMVKAGLNPVDIIVPPPEPKKPDPSVGFTFKGDDLLGPQAPMVLEILAQCGIKITPDAVQMSAQELNSQMILGLRDASGKIAPQQTHQDGAAPHGGPADKVRPLNQQSADLSGQRPGVKPQVQ
jgi:hypothetical protein